jgi:glycosyltransferase involved in cell wall biosynthesis
MRIAIDVTALLPLKTGIDTYLTQLVFHLAKVDMRNEYMILHNHEDRRLFAGNLPPNFGLLSICVRPRPIRLFSQQIAFPAATAIWKADIVHSPSFIMPYLRGSARHVLTVHDMTSFSHPNCHIPLRRSEIYKRILFASLHRTDLVIVPSQSTREAILKFLPDFQPDRIHVTVPGIGEEFRLCDRALVQEVAARLTLPQPYILYVGTLEPRKNLPMLVESYRRLVETGTIKEHLVLAGKLGWGYESLLKQIKVPALRGKVHLAGYVDRKALPAVYAGARLFVYPSLHEGFGFPPLEAMACGVPVISTQTSSLVENLKEAAELVEPNDVQGLAEAMRRVLTDDVRWAALRAQGLERASRYRWEQTARETLNVYYMAAARPKGTDEGRG